MSEARELVQLLIERGLDPAEAAEIVIRAALLAKPKDDAAERRRARDREYQAEKRRQSRTISAESAESADATEKEAPRTPQEKTPPVLPSSPPMGAQVPVVAGDLELAVDAYNLVAAEVGLPRAKLLTPERRRHLRARLAEHGLDGWRAAVEGLRAPFCLGENDRGWRASFDFCLQSKSLAKLAENAFAGDARGPPMTGGMVAAASDEIAFRMAIGELPRHGRQGGNPFGDQGASRALSAPADGGG